MSSMNSLSFAAAIRADVSLRCMITEHLKPTDTH